MVLQRLCSPKVTLIMNHMNLELDNYSIVIYIRNSIKLNFIKLLIQYRVAKIQVQFALKPMVPGNFNRNRYFVFLLLYIYIFLHGV